MPHTMARVLVRLFVYLLLAVVCFGSQSDLEQLTLSIQELLTRDNLTDASRRIAEALQQYPNEGGLFNLRGIVHARRDELEAARKDFETSVRLTPSLVPGWQNLARSCQIEGERNKPALACSIHAWQQVAHLKANDSEANGALGLLLEREGHFKESLAALAKLPEADASQTGSLLLQCMDRAALGQREAAQRLAAELASRPDFTESDFLAGVARFDSPENAATMVTLAEGLDSRQAAGLESLKNLAVGYERLSRMPEARKTLERVAILDPQNTAHLLELARIADKSGDHEGALGYLAHARDLAPGNAQIHFLFAMVATELNLAAEARESLKKALALEPDNPAYNYGMGYVILSTRDAASAADYFAKFVRARPGEARGHYALGIAYFVSGDYAKAKAEMQRVENDSKTAGGAAYFLGRIARLEDNLDEATHYLLKSIQLMPAFAESHTELGRVHLVKGDSKLARLEFERALQLDPKSFQANTQMLALYRRMHDPRAEQQSALVKELDEERSKRAELMLRSVEFRP